MSLTIKKIEDGPNCTECDDYYNDKCPLARAQRAVNNLADLVSSGATMETDGNTAINSGVIDLGPVKDYNYNSTPAGIVSREMQKCGGSKLQPLVNPGEIREPLAQTLDGLTILSVHTHIGNIRVS